MFEGIPQTPGIRLRRISLLEPVCLAQDLDRVDQCSAGALFDMEPRQGAISHYDVRFDGLQLTKEPVTPLHR